MKPLTIPKLELQADPLAVQPWNEIQSALTVPVERTFMWTDNNTLYRRMQSTDKLSVFVANWVAEGLE